MSDTDPTDTNSDLSDNEELREIAAQIMVHLEDAHEAAMEAQTPGLNRDEIQSGFDEVRRQLAAIEKLLIDADDAT